MTRPAGKALNKPLLIVGTRPQAGRPGIYLSVIIGANDGGSKSPPSFSSSPCVSGADSHAKTRTSSSFSTGFGSRKLSTIRRSGSIRSKGYGKPYAISQALQRCRCSHALLCRHRFIDDSVFLTKRNQVGLFSAAKVSTTSA